jgi:hypothetical protein
VVTEKLRKVAMGTVRANIKKPRGKRITDEFGHHKE